MFRLADHIPWGGDARKAPCRHYTLGSKVPPEVAYSAPWFLKTSSIDRSPQGTTVVGEFLASAEAVAAGAERVLASFRPDVVLMVNGLFTAEHVIRRIARQQGIRVVTYELSPTANALVFAQDEAASHRDTDALWRAVEDRPLTPAQEAELDALLRSREQGTGTHLRYFGNVKGRGDEIREALGLRGARRVVSLFTNLSWDSAALGRNVAFPSMLDWVEAACRAAAAARDTHLVVRVHPAEKRWGTREHVFDEVSVRLGGLPSNVRFVRPEEPLSSYALMDISDLVLTYTSTVGLEAAARGRPVAVAGDAHYRSRGFTMDISSPQDLHDAITGEKVILPTDESIARARRYAFAFFFRGNVPFPPVKVSDALPVAVVEEPDALLPGQDVYLDFICDRILHGGEFVLPVDVPHDSLPSDAEPSGETRPQPDRSGSM